MRVVYALAAAFILLAVAPPMRADQTPVGGANSPKPSPPPALSIGTGELSVGDFTVRVPVGDYTAPVGGAPAYTVPGPIVAFKGPDGVWRGHGYLETYPRLLKFSGAINGQVATLTYTFENNRTYKATLTARAGAVLLDETSDLGPRNVYVFDCYYQWLPAAGFALSLDGKRHAFIYMPCYYDRPEATVNPVAQTGDAAAPGGVAVISPDESQRDVAGFWCRDVQSWQGGESMGLQLWQRRQLPGDPNSRHFLGPETKSDSTPNPRTAGLLGPSLYEGHVTIEMNLGKGTRRLGFAVTARGATRQTIPQAFSAVVAAHP